MPRHTWLEELRIIRDNKRIVEVDRGNLDDNPLRGFVIALTKRWC